MKFLQRLLTVAAIAASSGAVGVDAVKLMPFGDSITELGCWRAMLWQKLQTAGYTNVDFVGSGRSSTNCNIANYDADHEGHSSYLATLIADYNQLVGWLSYANPDIVVMHLGTNDQSQSKTTQQILDAYTKMVGQMRANNPKMKILVAKIIPMYINWCTYCLPGVIALNNAIGPWAAQLSTSDSPITVVDQYTGFNVDTDTGDGIHPNLSGDQKIANNWYPAVVAALGGTAPPVTSTTTTRTTSTSIATSTRTSSTTATPTQTGALVPAWGQCGGIGWTGGTVCVSGYTCKVANPYYSQCLTP